jgi:hypothetical protein
VIARAFAPAFARAIAQAIAQAIARAFTTANFLLRTSNHKKLKRGPFKMRFVAMSSYGCLVS